MFSCCSSSMKPTLPKLATELVELIACWLGPADLCSLRLVCNDLRQKSIRSFGASFATIRTDLSRKSLQKLQVISEDDNLRLHVQTLVILQCKGEKLGQDFLWHRHSSGYLEAPLPGLEKLQYLLAHNLPNCRSFHIYKPGGVKTDYDAITTSDVVALILRIVPSISNDHSNSLPVKSFIVGPTSPTVVVTPRFTGTIDAKRVQMLRYRRASFQKAWAHIQELVLHHVFTPTTLDWGMDLISNATSLRKLSLDFNYSYSRPFLERLCQVTSLHSLESFKLACARTSVEVLSRLIGRSHDTLRVLSLSKIYLQRLTDWPIVLGQLRDQAPSLHSISIYSLANPDYEAKKIISFSSLIDDPVVPESGGRKFTLIKDRKWRELIGVEYQGPRVDKALDRLLNALEFCQKLTM